MEKRIVVARVKEKTGMEGKCCGYKRTVIKHLCNAETVLCLNFINLITLIVILHFSVTRYYHWWKLGKRQMESSILFLTTACESIIISKLKV